MDILQDASSGDLAAAGVIELVPERLYLLGGTVPLDGRISWVPADATGWQPVNAYVLRENGGALIVDPGIYAHREIINRQLARVVPPGSPISIFLTRAEPDAAGNIGEVAGHYPVTMLYAGGGPNPFDAFDQAAMLDPQSRSNRIQMERMPAGYEVPVAGSRGLEVLRPIIRLLATYWGYDRATRTLFTSDSFSHALQREPDGARVLRSTVPNWADLAHVKSHLLAKFGWLQHARTQSVLNNFRELRADRDIERIAPARGLVIEGRDVVEQHLQAVETVLKELAA